MEQVIAYKAFNGRLYETAEKCLAYEKKMAKYPKRTDETIKAEPTYLPYEKPIEVNIVKHIIKTQAKPSAKVKYEKYYVVGDKYKFTGCMDFHMMLGVLDHYKEEKNYQDYAMNDRVIAEFILKGNELTDKNLQAIVDKFHQYDKHSKMTLTILETNKKWRVEDLRWQSGQLAPNIVTIEKL